MIVKPGLHEPQLSVESSVTLVSFIELRRHSTQLTVEVRVNQALHSIQPGFIFVAFTILHTFKTTKMLL